MTGLLRIYTLGGLQVFKGDEPVTALETRKVEALLVYLACTRRVHSREVLAELLWEERSQQQSLANLRVALANLRKYLGEFLEISREGVGLAPGSQIWLDVAELEENLSTLRTGKGVKTPQTAECIEKAVALYRGEFLEGFFVRDCQGFEDWYLRERERLHRLTVEALHDLVDYEIERRAYKTGVAHAMRLLELDPLMETAHRQMMSLLASSGRRGEALAQYQACRKILHEELGIEPAAATKALYEKIRQGELVGTAAGARVIKGYEIKEQIGVGNFGAVYRAHQPGVQRDVAVKVILPQFANDPEFIRRFEAEAQIVARLEHPHIVPLYDYWREAEGAYLVMRCLRGGSLEDELRGGVPGVERAVEVVEQVASALSAAHRQGIIHRDLKPANILLDEEGNTYLSDFGIAKVLEKDGGKTQSGAWVGSPVYMSPEQIRAEALGPQSDIYSLGVMVYEMLTGELPFAVDSLGALIDKQLHEALPLVHKKRAELPPQVDEVLQRATAKNPADRYPGALSFAAAFRQAITGVSIWDAAEAVAAIKPGLVNPYKGLRAFQEADADDFFGREALTERLIARLGEEGEGSRFLAVVGPSGCGKSSLVKAGLVPALRKGALPGSEKWFILEMLPGAHPFEELEIGLLRIAARPELNLTEQLRRDERGLVRAARLALPEEGSQLLLIVDQFEELFTLVSDKAEAKGFLESLYAAVTEPHSPLRVIITLRADFYDRPLTHPDFSRLVQARTEVVVPLTVEELQSAIRAPADRVGVSVETGLATAIVAEVIDQAGALPLLQYALTELFERREDGRLTRQAYQSLGGIQGVLGRRAEEVYASLDDASQIAARQLFLRLVTLGEGTEDTRRRVLRSELETLAEIDAQVPNGSKYSTIEAAIQAFGRARLLSFDRDPLTRSPTVEVAHEALLREWPRLRQWLDASRADVRQERLLGNAAAEWLNAGRDPSFLLRGARLSQFEGWAATTQLALTHSEQDFLEASLTERQTQEEVEAIRQRQELETAQKLAETEKQRAEEQTQAARRLRLRAWLLAGAALLTLILAFVAFLARQNAIRAHQVSFSRELAAGALNNLDADPERSVLLSLQALAEADTLEAVNALHRSVPAQHLLRTLTGHTNWIHELALSPDGTLLASVDVDGMLILWDAASGEKLYTFTPHPDAPPASLAFSPDGSLLATSSYDNTAKIWRLSAGGSSAPQELFTLSGHSGVVNGIAFSPDGKLFATGSDDATAILWDMPASLAAGSGQKLHTLVGHTRIQDPAYVYNAGINQLTFSPDGKYLITAGSDETVRIWDTASGQQSGLIHAHPGGAYKIAIRPDGTRLATVGEDLLVKIWDFSAAPGQVNLLYSINMPGNALAFSPDATRLALGAYSSGLIQIWGAASGKLLLSLPGHTSTIHTVAFSPDGTRLFSASEDMTIKIWGLSPDHELLAFSPSSVPAYSPDGSLLATGNPDGKITLRDALTGQPMFTLDGHQGKIIALEFSPDGRRLASATQYDPPKVWDLASRQEITSLKGHTDMINNVVFSPDGQRLATASVDGTASIWDSASGQRLLTVTSSPPEGDVPMYITDVAFSRDSKSLVTTCGDGTAKIWDAASGQLLHTLEIGAEPTAVGFKPDGKLMAIGLRSGIAMVYEVTSSEPRPVLTLAGHTGGVSDIHFSPDGSLLATASYDNTIKVWDAATGQERMTLAGAASFLWLAFSPDGRRLAAMDYDFRTLVFALRVEDLIDLARQRLTRGFTNEECKQYLHIEQCPPGPQGED